MVDGRVEDDRRAGAGQVDDGAENTLDDIGGGEDAFGVHVPAQAVGPKRDGRSGGARHQLGMRIGDLAVVDGGVEGGGDLRSQAEVHLGHPRREDVGSVEVPLEARSWPLVVGGRAHRTKARAVAGHRPSDQF